jgi:hypothetical protein
VAARESARRVPCGVLISAVRFRPRLRAIIIITRHPRLVLPPPRFRAISGILRPLRTMRPLQAPDVAPDVAPRLAVTVLLRDTVLALADRAAAPAVKS